MTTHPLRLGVLALFFFLSVAASSAAPSNQTEGSGRKRPHIILVLADDLGWNDVGFQGNSKMPTPNLDKLAREGLILDDQYTSPWCTPTRAALLTGRYPVRYGLQHIVAMPNRPIGLPLDEKLLPQYLKPLGYASHLVGKWHLGYHDPAYLPTSRGFDSFYGTYFNVDHVTHEWTVSNANVDCQEEGSPSKCSELLAGLSKCSGSLANDTHDCEMMRDEFFSQRCFEEAAGDIEFPDGPVPAQQVTDDGLPPTFTGKNWQQDTPESRERATKRDGMYASEDITLEALEILDEHPKDDPLFLMMAFTAVHLPIVLDEKHNVPECAQYPFPDRAVMCSMMNGMDDGVGQVIQKLKEKGMYEDSIVIFLADNGGRGFQSSNAPFRGQKSTLLQGGVRVPAFIHAPGRLHETGTRKSGLIHAVDWFSTILALGRGGAGGEDGLGEDEGFKWFGKNVDGKNMWSFLSEPWAKSSRQEVLLNIDPLCAAAPQSLTVGPHSAYIFDKWKYMEGDPGLVYLYNCFTGDGNSLPGPPTTFICPFPLNEDGVALIDLENDPTESVNVADEQPLLVAFMKKRVEMFRRQSADPLWTNPDPRCDPSLYGGWWTPYVNNPNLE